MLIVKEGRLVFDGALADVVARYAKHKVLTAKLDAAAGAAAGAAALASVGEVVEATEATVRLRVPRERTVAAAGELLARLPVADLTIEEDDVAAIVGRIFAERGERPS